MQSRDRKELLLGIKLRTEREQAKTQAQLPPAEITLGPKVEGVL